MANNLILDFDLIQGYKTNIETLDNTLLNKDFKELSNVLSSVNSNVTSASINPMINNIISNITLIENSIRRDLTKIEEFLTEQLANYQMNVYEAQINLETVLNKMLQLSEGIVPLVSAGEINLSSAPSESAQSTGTNSDSEIASLRQEVDDLKEKIPDGFGQNSVENWNEFADSTVDNWNHFTGEVAAHFDDIGSYWDYSNVDNIFDAVFTTAGAAVNTVWDAGFGALRTAGDAVGLVAHEAVDLVVGAANEIGDFVSALLTWNW